MLSVRGWLGLGRRAASIYFHPDYRFPLSSAELPPGLEVRRAEDAFWYLRTAGVIRERDVRTPVLVTYEQLARAHAEDYLESLGHPEVLARVFGLVGSELSVDELLRSVRLGCGATLMAAREVLAAGGGAAMNLFGGFHHAGRARGGGFCAVNDIAVATATLRAEGFRGPVAVLDLDAHPPDGTADCIGGEPGVWIGSISGSAFGALPGTDEVVLPEGTGDAAYLAALDALLSRMPRAELVFVLAGGDVLAGDAMGRLALTLRGARRRDLNVLSRLGPSPSVWLPGGGYSRDAWRLLAGTALAITFRSTERVASRFNPLRSRFRRIASQLSTDALGGGDWISEDDVAAAMGLPRTGARKLLGFYTREGLEYALHRYGILEHLRRLGYAALTVDVDTLEGSDRLRVLGEVAGAREPLIELALERKALPEGVVLFVHWLALRHPRAQFTAARPRLPGQEVPGLGIFREVIELLLRISERLVLDGVAFRPAWFHMAYPGRHRARFVDPSRQGQFEALLRDLGHLPLIELTRALHDGRVLMNEVRYAWEPADMVAWRTPRPSDEAEVARVRAAAHFSLSDPPPG